MRPRLNDLSRSHLSVVPSTPSSSELLDRYEQVAARQQACDRMVVQLAIKDRLMRDAGRVPSVASVDDLGVLRHHLDGRMASVEGKMAQIRREQGRLRWWNLAALLAVLTSLVV